MSNWCNQWNMTVNISKVKSGLWCSHGFCTPNLRQCNNYCFLRSPKGGCCSISDDLSCSSKRVAGIIIKERKICIYYRFNKMVKRQNNLSNFNKEHTHHSQLQNSLLDKSIHPRRISIYFLKIIQFSFPNSSHLFYLHLKKHTDHTEKEDSGIIISVGPFCTDKSALFVTTVHDHGN